MPFAIALHFISGHYHATPWGRHVNEAVPEYPPSLWRLFRALVAVWKRKMSDDGQIHAEVLGSALKKLADPLPSFVLPPATLGHTRHYLDQGKKGSAFVIDTFINMAKDTPLVVVWKNAELNEEEAQTIIKLVEKLDYLGRSESWVEGSVLSPEKIPAFASRINCVPFEEKEQLISDGEMVTTLVPHPHRFREWDFGKKVQSPEPAWNLLAESGDLFKEGWSDPPGSRWTQYVRPFDCFEEKPSSHTPPVSRPHVMRWKIQGNPLPSVQETIYVAEIVKRYLNGIYGKLFDQDFSEIFMGKDKDGTPLQGHQHAYYLPTDEDGDGKIDHINIYAERGFDTRELKALEQLKHIQKPGGGEDLRLYLVGCWNKEEGIQHIPVFRPARHWVSVTPYIAPRHYKKRGQKKDTCSLEEFPAVTLREELQKQAYPLPDIQKKERYSPISYEGNILRGKEFPWLFFRQQRVLGKSHGNRTNQPGSGFELVFSEPVKGPLCFGYGAHYGMGFFAPLRE